ncbi:type II secretion system protein GspM [Gallaecimonas pentaromativorans]|uniref:type II secretion system protein GspM n=1 Tax=Gallaecimonas pentaromativorans TaxID=584787 RepID=UPI003A8E111F
MTLQSRAQPLLALLVLALGLLLLWLLLVAPLYGYFSARLEQLSTQQDMLARYQRLGQRIPELEQQLAILKRQRPAENLYLQAPTPALAAARLQQRLNQLVGQVGGQLVSTQIVNGDTDSPLPKVVLAVRMRAETPELARLLYELEANRPLLFVDDLVVTANPRLTLVTAASRSGIAPLATLDIRFSLVAYAGGDAQ